MEHCPTELMIADHFIKPLQGKIFHTFCELIMGWKSIDDVLLAIRISAKERVENRKVVENANDQKSRITYKEALMNEKKFKHVELRTEIKSSKEVKSRVK